MVVVPINLGYHTPSSNCTCLSLFKDTRRIPNFVRICTKVAESRPNTDIGSGFWSVVNLNWTMCFKANLVELDLSNILGLLQLHHGGWPRLKASCNKIYSHLFSYFLIWDLPWRIQIRLL